MPNWCNNILTITAIDDADIGTDIYQALIPDEALKAEDITAYREEGWGQLVFTFSKVYPLPEKLINTGGWYNWCIDNWGTKWDAACTYINKNEPKVLEFSYDTAWSPAEGEISTAPWYVDDPVTVTLILSNTTQSLTFTPTSGWGSGTVANGVVTVTTGINVIAAGSTLPIQLNWGGVNGTYQDFTVVSCTSSIGTCSVG